ncbi:MAG: hypothetical protein KGM44_04045 [bacterium]|nr:hypothetical protein [bacterium]
MAAHPGYTPPPLAPPAIVQRYQDALAALPIPPYLVFEYTVDQVGWHDLAQTHRIYRAEGVQRDELIADSGHPVKPVVVRIKHGVRDRYAVGNVAPQPPGYTFTYAGTVHAGSHPAYVFTTKPTGAPRGFSVRRVVIDGVSYLPTQISFDTHGNKASGAGTMFFAKSGEYWVPTRVAVAAQVDGNKATESIAFSGYSFPSALPPATFKAARSAP